MRLVRAILILLLVLAPTAFGQLAITEAMSSASTNKGPALVTQNSDFWELTNFGDTAIDLTGYKFFDNGNNLAGADPTIFEGLIINPNESILFVQGTVNTNETQVREWWSLDPAVKIRFYASPGLSSTGDGLRLWAPGTTDAADVVDSVDFSEAQRGSSFTYNPETGEFGIYSAISVGGAFQAATADDIGSPGKNTGPTPLRITQQPASTVVNAGDTARLTVVSQSRPRARVQWYFKNNPIDGATKPTLEVPNFQNENTGAYYARLSNGVTNVNSASVEIVLQGQATAPAFTASPTDLTLTIGQGRMFHSHATGVPQPTYQWQFAGANIEGATSEDLAFTATSVEQTGDYTVIAQNALGSATNQVRITVTTAPRLVITEVMSSEIANTPPHADFWELTNFGDFAVQLKGYRFDDNSELIATAFTFTNDVTIAPGESIIFTEAITADAFKTWWGADKLPPNLKILTYTGNGLSSNGDAVNVWNAAASENFDKIASVVFSVATIGVSFRYNPDTQLFGELSTVGTFGAFAAAVGGDIGSPGYVTAPPAPLNITEFKRVEAGLSVTWSAAAGTTYKLQSRDELGAGAWTTVRTVNATTASTTEIIDFDSAAAQRFYQVIIE